MDDIETVIEGRMLVDGELGYAQVGISEDGRIVAVGRYVSGGERRVELGTSEMLLPGFIDPHVHLRDPGMTWKEDFGTGTLAAIHAGVTCVYDMPNTAPPVVDPDTLLSKSRAVRGRAFTDYGLFAAVTPGINARMLAPYVVGFKLFMGSTTGNILLDDDEELVPAVGDALSTGRRLSVHAEDDHLISKDEERCCRDHMRNRPPEAEWNAISRLAAHFKGKAINICHVTTEDGLDLAKAAGFTTEITMHHMTFDADGHPSAEYKVNPPIRTSAVRDALRRRFLSGGFDMIGTDHAPHTAEEKSRPFQEAPSGIPGVETTMPIVMESVRRGDLPISEAVRMGASEPGSLFQVGKGRIAPGYDADFAVFDMRRSVAIDAGRLHSRCGHSPYGGFDAVFPKTVVVRGSIQVEDWEFCGEPIGRNVRGLRGRLFRDRRKACGMPAGVRDVLPLSAGGPSERKAVLQEEPSEMPRHVSRPGAVHGSGSEEGQRVLRIPREPQMHDLRPSHDLLSPVSVPSVRQRQAPGRA